MKFHNELLLGFRYQETMLTRLKNKNLTYFK